MGHKEFRGMEFGRADGRLGNITVSGHQGAVSQGTWGQGAKRT
jgi:hypothetical protein